MKTVVITQEKGGCGKTTTAVHFAWYFERKGLRVLLIDLDAQGNATYTLDGHGCEITADALFKGPVELDRLPDQRLTLIPGTRDLVDIAILDRAAALDCFHVNIAALGEHFDIAVIDTPPTFGITNYAALSCATHVLAPMDLQDFAVLGVTNLLQTIQGITEGINPDLRFLGLLPSKFRWNSSVQKEHLATLLGSMGDMILPEVIALRTAYERSTQERLPVWKLPGAAGRDASDEMLRLLDGISATMGFEP
jgi:chromosome partitioning protein